VIFLDDFLWVGVVEDEEVHSTSNHAESKSLLSVRNAFDDDFNTGSVVEEDSNELGGDGTEHEEGVSSIDVLSRKRIGGVVVGWVVSVPERVDAILKEVLISHLFSQTPDLGVTVSAIPSEDVHGQSVEHASHSERQASGRNDRLLINLVIETVESVGLNGDSLNSLEFFLGCLKLCRDGEAKRVLEGLWPGSGKSFSASILQEVIKVSGLAIVSAHVLSDSHIGEVVVHLRKSLLSNSRLRRGGGSNFILERIVLAEDEVV